MNRKQWLKDNQWFIDAIANETPVLFSDNGVDWKKGVPVGFHLDLDASPFIYRGQGNVYKYAKPLPKTERRYLDPVEMMQWLVDHGYLYSDGMWTKYRDVTFVVDMFKYCGDKVTEHGNDTIYSWHPEWIKEIEVTE